MSPRPFETKFMKHSVLTATLEELTSRPVAVLAAMESSRVGSTDRAHGDDLLHHDTALLRNIHEPLRDDVEDGVKNQRVLDAIARSAASRRRKEVRAS